MGEGNGEGGEVFAGDVVGAITSTNTSVASIVRVIGRYTNLNSCVLCE